jgi:hypothetical protein
LYAFVGKIVPDLLHAQVNDLLFLFIFPVKINGIGKFCRYWLYVEFDNAIFKDKTFQRHRA